MKNSIVDMLFHPAVAAVLILSGIVAAVLLPAKREHLPLPQKMGSCAALLLSLAYAAFILWSVIGFGAPPPEAVPAPPP